MGYLILVWLVQLILGTFCFCLLIIDEVGELTLSGFTVGFIISTIFGLIPIVVLFFSLSDKIVIYTRK